MELVYEPSRSQRPHTHPRQLLALSALPPRQRFEHFLHEALARREVWGLCRGKHWLLIRTVENGLALPLWSAWEHSEDWNAHHHQIWAHDYAPRAIRLCELTHELIPLLRAEQLAIGCFFVPENNGLTMSPDALCSTLLTMLRSMDTLASQ